MWWIGPIVTSWHLATLTVSRWIDSVRISVGDWAIKRWYGPMVITVLIAFLVACFLSLASRLLENAGRK